MAHTRTARKAVRQNRTRRVRNKAALSAMRTQVKKVRTAIASKDAEVARKELARAQKLVDKCAKTRRIHANKAARMKSGLARSVGELGD